MKKILCSLFMICFIFNFSYAKEIYTDLKDPKNTQNIEDTLKPNRSDYAYLTSNTEDFNGMGFKSFSYGCRGEDYLETENSKGEYSITGRLDFVSNSDGKYSKVVHKGMDIQNYSKTIVGWSYSCHDRYYDEDEEEYVECSGYGKQWNETRYKAYTKEQFESTIKSYTNPSWCSHVASSYASFIGKYENEKIRRSASQKVEYYVYDGMPVGIPAIALVTSIDPSSSDLWVATFSVDGTTQLYNSGVYQIFDSKCNPHIKHTATELTKAERELTGMEYFSPVHEKSLKGQAFYEDTLVKGTTTVYRFLLACDSCSTCERCITSDYDKLNTYVAYGEVPEFYLSRGCPIHSCCFVYDYPVTLPDEYEGIKCPDLKLEGDKYIACEAHTCKRWLEHSDYRENFAPQSCLKVVAGRAITDTESGSKLVRYTGQVDEGIVYINGKIQVIDGGYSDYCSNHMCNSFFCDSPREDSESYAAKYDKQKNMVSMANEYCTSHKNSCRLVKSYKSQPYEQYTGNGGDTIIEQIEKAKREKKFSYCNGTVTQTYYAYIQPDAMICESCYNSMGKNKLKSENGNFDIGKCPSCGDTGVNVFDCNNGKWCATCIDFRQFSISHRNVENYDYSDVRGTQRERRCEFNVQRFAGDNTSLCGERCVEGKRYCYWHLCDTEKCVEPVKYSGSYFCQKCVPYVDTSKSSLLGKYPTVADDTNKLEDKYTNDDETTSENSPKYDQITPVELRKLLSEGKGITYSYKGKAISLTNRQAKILLNKIDGECSYTPELATAVAQVLLNNHLYLNKSMEEVLTGNTSYAPTITTTNYTSNAVLGLANIINNNSVSQEVNSIIGNSVLFAGDIDEKTNYNNAMASYAQVGKAFLTEGTVLGNPPGAITVFGTAEAYPSKCSSCGRYVPISGKCSCGN